MKRIHAAGPILAAALTLLPAIAGASDAAMAKLVECMKLKAASPEQQACLKQVETLHAAAKTAPAAIKAPKMAAAVAPGARPVAKAAPPTVIAVPPEVKHAAAEVGLAGAPAQAKTVSAGSSISGIGGGITVGDLKGLDLESAMMAIQSQRANLLEATLKNQIDAVQARNNDIAKMNETLSILPKMPADKEKGIRDQLRAWGLSSPDAKATPEQVANWQQGLKAKIDAANNSQQMDMLKLQSLTNKRNEAFDLMTNFIKKMADSRSSVLGNMR